VDTPIPGRPGDGRGGSELGEDAVVGRIDLDDVDAQLRDGGDPREPQAGFEAAHGRRPASR
jgi:hypothetical protein